VYGIVKQSDGYIHVASELERGTTFEILLPRVLVRVAQPDLAPSRPLPSGSGRIMVVEDEPAARGIICKHLRRAGYDVIEADNGVAALAAIATAPPLDLLLTDIVMPQMNGRALAEQVTTLDPNVKILYMTGYSDDPDVTRDVEARRRPLLQKPFSAKALLEAIQELLAPTAATK
jgi:CheY-like chemotaxis protein